MADPLSSAITSGINAGATALTGIITSSQQGVSNVEQGLLQQGQLDRLIGAQERAGQLSSQERSQALNVTSGLRREGLRLQDVLAQNQLDLARTRGARQDVIELRRLQNQQTLSLQDRMLEAQRFGLLDRFSRRSRETESQGLDVDRTGLELGAESTRRQIDAQRELGLGAIGSQRDIGLGQIGIERLRTLGDIQLQNRRQDTRDFVVRNLSRGSDLTGPSGDFFSPTTTRLGESILNEAIAGRDLVRGGRAGQIRDSSSADRTRDTVNSVQRSLILAQMV